MVSIFQFSISIFQIHDSYPKKILYCIVRFYKNATRSRLRGSRGDEVFYVGIKVPLSENKHLYNYFIKLFVHSFLTTFYSSQTVSISCIDFRMLLSFKFFNLLSSKTTLLLDNVVLLTFFLFADLSTMNIIS